VKYNSLHFVLVYTQITVQTAREITSVTDSATGPMEFSRLLNMLNDASIIRDKATVNSARKPIGTDIIRLPTANMIISTGE
jgi:hypothetical protein